MNRMSLLFPFALIFALCLASPSYLTGCKSPPTAAQVTYNTLDGVGASVDAAMKTAAQLKVAGKINSDQWTKVAAAHAKFLASYNAAIDLAAVSLDKATVPANVAALAGDVLAVVATFQK